MTNSTYICVIIIVIILVGVLYIGNRESFSQPGDSPPFLYPAYIQQPPGPRGWGYRDPQATKQTLLWEQDRPVAFMPKPQPQPNFPYSPNSDGGVVGFHTHSVESAPVEKKHSPFEATADRPIVPNLRPRAVAVAPFASW